ncbi:Hypothetical Protein U712_17885 [Bacillus subtilis PY79]|nr:Hypothetical Protein U712_17885 [Bacillus subtilis PY79]EME07681.1 hypothetical protein BS732_0508 [Bacillus subtilis MB73/2]
MFLSLLLELWLYVLFSFKRHLPYDRKNLWLNYSLFTLFNMFLHIFMISDKPFLNKLYP